MNSQWKRRRLGLQKRKAKKAKTTPAASRNTQPFAALNRGRRRGGIVRMQTGGADPNLLQVVTARLASAKEAGDKALRTGLEDNLRSQSQRFQDITRQRSQDREIISALAFDDKQRDLIAQINDEDTDPEMRRKLIKQLRNGVSRQPPPSGITDQGTDHEMPLAPPAAADPAAAPPVAADPVPMDGEPPAPPPPPAAMESETARRPAPPVPTDAPPPPPAAMDSETTRRSRAPASPQPPAAMRVDSGARTVARSKGKIGKTARTAAKSRVLTTVGGAYTPNNDAESTGEIKRPASSLALDSARKQARALGIATRRAQSSLPAPSYIVPAPGTEVKPAVAAVESIANDSNKRRGIGAIPVGELTIAETPSALFNKGVTISHRKHPETNQQREQRLENYEANANVGNNVGPIEEDSDL